MPDGELPFDRAVIDDGGQLRELSVEEFTALPLSVRVQHVLQRSVSFYHRDEPVQLRVALKSLRATTAA